MRIERENLEFLISQYLDGTLSEDERIALEEFLERDGEARGLLEEYRKLDAVLKDAPPLPAVAWDRLATRISDAVAEAEESEPVARPILSIGFWARPAQLALAASVLIAIGLGVQVYLSSSGSSEKVAMPAVAVVQVTGPEVEKAAGEAKVAVEFGPASPVAEHVAASSYNEGLVAQPTRVIIATGGDSAQDSESIYQLIVVSW